MFTELHAHAENLIASYADGSGTYRIHLIPAEPDAPAILITIISDEEYIADDIRRAPEFDNDSADMMLTETFGSSPDHGSDGVVWINGEAFAVIGQSDGVVVDAVAGQPLPTEEQIAAAIERGKREILADLGTAVSSRGDVLPIDTRDFATLHDYVDANCYGGICDDDEPCDWTRGIHHGADAGSRVLDALASWLKTLPLPDGTPVRTFPDEPVFYAAHLDEQRWNGFEVPSFTRAETQRVMNWINGYGVLAEESYAWDGDDVICTDLVVDETTTVPSFVTESGERLWSIGVGYVWERVSDETEA